MPTLIIEHFGYRKALPFNATLWIGRDTDCQIIISHPTVSRRHARIELAGTDAAIVTDNGSRNGTMIAGERLTGPRQINNGDIFKIGPATITFAAGEPERPIDAPSVDAEDAGGILYLCQCGARLWAPRGASGATTICPKCRRSLKCPDETVNVRAIR